MTVARTWRARAHGGRFDAYLTILEERSLDLGDSGQVVDLRFHVSRSCKPRR